MVSNDEILVYSAPHSRFVFFLFLPFALRFMVYQDLALRRPSSTPAPFFALLLLFAAP